VVTPVGHDCEFSGVGERFAHRPWGLFGGEPGATGQFHLSAAGGTTRRLANKVRMPLRAGESVVVETPGAGGYGPPSERRPDALAEDERTAKFTPTFMAEHYKR
jgi:N-methylhydantoinase B